MRIGPLISTLMVSWGACGAAPDRLCADAEPVTRFEVPGGYYLVATPPGYEPGHCPPLIITLHGTDTHAGDMIRAWRSLDLPVPGILVAPQNVSAGWEDSEAPLLQDIFEDVQRRFTFDSQRVLLTGHSAGGAMTFYMIYDRGFPATAAATSANYLPPTVTRDQIQARADVPLFYAVGKDDINHRRMRDALVTLRTSGASVTVLTLDIGHVLHRGVLQQAADWFGRITAECTTSVLDEALRAFEAGQVAIAVHSVEGILEQRAYHPPGVLERAEALHHTVTLPGNREMHAVRTLIAGDRISEAMERLSRLEAAYAGCRWAEQAIALRQKLQAERHLPGDLKSHLQKQRQRHARELLLSAHKLLSNNRLDEARTQCRLLADSYGDLPEGRQAAQLLNDINWRGR